MTEQETTSTQEQAKTEQPEPSGIGIVGDTTTHDLVMTRIWVQDGIISNAEIRVLGGEFTRQHASKLEQKLRGKKATDAEFIMGLNENARPCGGCGPLDTVYESIRRAFCNYHKPDEARSLEPELDVSSSSESPGTPADKIPGN